MTTACFSSRVLSSCLVIGHTVHVTSKTDHAVFKSSYWKAERAVLCWLVVVEVDNLRVGRGCGIQH